MTALVGTRQLVRLAIRRDRIILPVWILLLSFIPASAVGTFEASFPTMADRISLDTGARHNPSLSLLYGPAFDLTTAGGYTAFRYSGFVAVLIALMVIFTVTRHTRAEEDTGRLELLGSTVVGRFAPLTAAVLVSAGASMIIALLSTVSMIGAKLPVGGTLAFNLGALGVALVFTAVAAVAAQLTEFSRTANGIACAVLGGSFLLRSVGDSSTGMRWLSWLSPIGWAQQLRPFAGERWWVLGLPLVIALLVGAVAYVLLPRRDLGAAMFPARLGPARAPASLSSTLGLAWRLQRGSLLGWGVGMVVAGSLFGSLASGVGELVGDNPAARDMLQRMGGSTALVDTFLAVLAGVYGMFVSIYAVQAALRVRGEETSFRAEPVLATSVSRIGWVASHLVFALLGTAALLGATGLAAGLTHGLRVGDVGGQLPRVLGGVLVQLPATWLVASVAMVLIGLLPRQAVAAWGIALAFLLISMFGPVANLPQAVLDVSPFGHIPKLPGTAFTATPLLWLTGIAVVGLAAGLVGLRRRDIG